MSDNVDRNGNPASAYADVGRSNDLDRLSREQQTTGFVHAILRMGIAQRGYPEDVKLDLIVDDVGPLPGLRLRLPSLTTHSYRILIEEEH